MYTSQVLCEEPFADSGIMEYIPAITDITLQGKINLEESSKFEKVPLACKSVIPKAEMVTSHMADNSSVK